MRRCILSILLENEPGALSRIVGLFSQRAFNIESLAVSPTDDNTLSRITIETIGEEHVIEQILKQVNKLVDVLKVTDLTGGPHIERELMLIKLAAHTIEARREVDRCVSVFRAQIVDMNSQSYVVEVVGSGEKLDAFIEAAGEYTEVIEVVRSGVIGIGRGERSLRP